MISGRKYIDDNTIINCKQYCPGCKCELEKVRVSKVVNSQSEEAKNFDFSNGDTFLTGDVEFIRHEFKCPMCNRRFTSGNMKNKSYTKIAFWILISQLVYIALLLINIFIAHILEVPCNGEGIYVIFAVSTIHQVILLPIFAFGVSITSIVFQVMALRSGESKAKNIIMMVIALLVFMAAVVYASYLGNAAMGV